MAFKPIQFDSGKMVEKEFATGVTVVKGNAVVDNGSGYLTNASASTAVDVRYVAAEGLTTTANGDLVLCWMTDGVTFEADTDAAWSVTDVNTDVDLGTAGNLNPDASTHDLFHIERGVGTAETDTKVIGHFTRGVPNS